MASYAGLSLFALLAINTAQPLMPPQAAGPAKPSARTQAPKPVQPQKPGQAQKPAQPQQPAQPHSTALPPQQHGKVDGSFVNGKFVITRSDIHKNGYHKGFPVVVIVDKTDHYTYVFQKQKDDKVVEVLRASNAVGKDDTPTPYGPYKVAKKVKWPSWIPPKSIDPKQKPIPPYNKTHKNPLGVARIGLNKFGINLHGTNDPHSLRHDVSHGCIRHSNQDILKIFNMVEPGDTVLIVKDVLGTTLDKQEFSDKTSAHKDEHKKSG